ncbi:peptide chain release factor 1 [Aerococcus viridans]|uniref:Peptide chain release factor 1 n=2 Tax=Aerococcus viridans TaxID=1377 RepID=A0AAU8U8R9_9LACT|nr:peptide chain release factor 1 [Aerococcus viridans]AMC01073.1 peptide chain release factor 1 [Aerococcus viridans]EFG50398.1 peptide chain release factor 1 [Aerococcus viridans ATCC 11563 = CCUG 4311]MEC1386548.1 peptide chain release factor 1 [Aerococcus viridans]SUU17882.1 Peptide chain release factor 1 [Aerococcus viridans]
MFTDQLDSFIARYAEVTELMSDPDVINDNQRFRAISKEEADLRPKVETFSHYKDVIQAIEDTEELLAESSDDEMTELAKEELKELKAERESLEEEIKRLMIPSDPNDDKNIIMEIRGAAGGDEAQLFAGDLYEMYSRYATSQGWRVEVIESSSNDIGGFKEITLQIQGDKVYSKLKFESGAHRVQRVPDTESQGRVHTSTATVGVMPELEDIDFDLDEGDIRIDIYRASGAGGQHVNKTSSAVRLTHEPTGIQVAMQDQRSQQQNKDKAMMILRSRVYEKIASEQQNEYDSQRKNLVGTGDRSERIRTYNYPQNRVTDHRIGLTIQKLDRIMTGELDEIVDALLLADQANKLEELND